MAPGSAALPPSVSASALTTYTSHGSSPGPLSISYELEGRFGDREVGVPRAPFGGFGAEGLRVEGDRRFEVADPEGELDTGHAVLGQGCCTGLTAAPLADLARTFKALGDPVRLRLLSMIASRSGGEVCVCDLTPAFDLSQPTISHHLKLLRQAGLIDCERRGTWVYYWVLPGVLDRLAAFLTTARTSEATT